MATASHDCTGSCDPTSWSCSACPPGYDARRSLRAKNRAQHVIQLLPIQRREMDFTREARAVELAEQRLECRRHFVVAKGADKEDRLLAQSASNNCEHLQATCITPMQVFDDAQDGAAAREVLQEGDQAFDDASAHLLLVIIGGYQAELGQQAGNVGADSLDGADRIQAVDERAGSIGKGRVRDRLVALEAGALDHPHETPRGGPFPHGRKQARLADAGLAADPDGLAVTTADLIERLTKGIQAGFTTDEPGDTIGRSRPAGMLKEDTCGVSGQPRLPGAATAAGVFTVVRSGKPLTDAKLETGRHPRASADPLPQYSTEVLHPCVAPVDATEVVLHLRWQPRPWLVAMALVALTPAMALWAAALADSLGITHVLIGLAVPASASSRAERLLLLDAFLTVMLVFPLLAALSIVLATVSFDLRIANWEITASMRLPPPPLNLWQLIAAAFLLVAAVLFVAMAGHLVADCVLGTDCVSG